MSGYPAQGSTPGAGAQPLPNIIVQPAAAGDEYPSFSVRKAVSTGAAQLLLGVLAIVFQITASSIGAAYGETYTGVWTGVFFVAAGVVGIATKTRKSCCRMTFYGVMSLLALFCALALISLAALGVDSDHEDKEDACEDRWDDFGDKGDDNSRDDDDYRDCGKYTARIAMNAMLLLFALMEMFISLYAIIICLTGCCGGKKSKQIPVSGSLPPGQAMVVFQSTTNPRQYVAYPNTQPAAVSQPPAYTDASPPPAYNPYDYTPPSTTGAGALMVAPPHYDNPIYHVDPADCSLAENMANEMKK